MVLTKEQALKRPTMTYDLCFKIFGADSQIMRDAMAEVAEPMLAQLSDREALIVNYRSAGATYEAIGHMLGVTRERVRQIEAKTYRRIRAESSKMVRDAVRRLRADRKRAEELAEIEAEYGNTVMAVTLDELCLSTRPHNILERAGVKTVADICNLGRGKLERLRNMGIHSMAEIESKLLELGVTIPNDEEDE